MILCSEPKAQYLAHKDPIDAAIREVLDSGRYVLGEQVAAFECEFADYVGAAEGIGVGNGTDAINITLRASGVGPGDEVVTVSHTAVATVAAIQQAGATPVLVDVDPVYYTLDPERLKAAITPRTRALVPVHLYGQPADMAAILDFARQRGLRVIEDCAQAHGARYNGRRVGALGDAGCFSFYPTKNLGALGDGGVIVTNDAEVAEQARRLRQYGWDGGRASHVSGVNTRLDEIQAAVLRVKLPHLDADNAARARIAERYRKELDGTGLVLPSVPEGATHVFHQFVVRSMFRDALLEHLRAKGVGAAIHYPQAVHQQPAYGGRLAGAGDLPATEALVHQILSLPVYPELDGESVDTVIGAVVEFMDSRG